jgi:hypothetical protein
MITNTGKDIIAKYLMGNAPAYASYMALGCGPKPRLAITSLSGASSATSIGVTTVTVSSTDGIWVGAKIVKTSGTGTLSGNTIVTSITGATTFTISPQPSVQLSSAVIGIQTDPTKNTLDFEMFRVPITSRGYINDNGVNKIILTTELPTEERYEITEVGIYSAGSNVNAGSYDSKTITAFADTENWQYNNSTSVVSPTLITGPLVNESNNMTTPQDSIQTNANNQIFLNSTRKARYESSRYLNNVLFLRGDTSHLVSNGTDFVIPAGSKFLQLSGQAVDLSRNSTSDLLKVAFSLVSVTGSSVAVPNNVRVLVEFANSDGSQYARMQVDVQDGDVYDLANNRYITVEKRLDELLYTATFSWKSVTIIKVYVSAVDTLQVTNKVGTTTVATLTIPSHGLPVNSTVTNVVPSGGTNPTITYTAGNTFAAGDVVTITGVSPVAYNLVNATVISATATNFVVSSSATGAYTSGGLAVVSNAKITITDTNGADSGFNGTHTITSVPSSSTISYSRVGSAVTSVAVSPPGIAQISRSEYFIALDALRLDNVSTVNPLYGMTGYSIIQDSQNVPAQTVIKSPNTNNYIEFRFILDVT